MRVAITGVTGFTGRHISAALECAGYEVFGLGKDGVQSSSKYLKADLADQTVISDWFNEIKPDCIIHLAALSHVVGSATDFYRVNVVGTESLLEAIADARITPHKIVIASSANIYGNSTSDLISERVPIAPVNHYGLSKATMEMMLRNWTERFPIVVARPFNYTGPGQSERFVFAKIVGTFRRREPVLRLGNTDVARDLSDVRYVAQVYKRLIECSQRSITVNICSGNSVSIDDAIDIMASIAGYKPAIEIDPGLVRRNEIKKMSGDSSLLKMVIGDITPIDIERTLYDMYVATT